MKTIFPCWDNGKKSYEKGGRMQCDCLRKFCGCKNMEIQNWCFLWDGIKIKIKLKKMHRGLTNCKKYDII